MAFRVICCSGLLFVATLAAANEMVTALVAKLASSDAFIRADAARALGELGESAESAVPDLVELFPDHCTGIRNADGFPGPRDSMSVDVKRLKLSAKSENRVFSILSNA